MPSIILNIVKKRRMKYTLNEINNIRQSHISSTDINNIKKKKRKIEGCGSVASRAASRGLFTITPKEIEDCEDITIEEQIILVHLLKNAYFQGTLTVQLALPILQKYTRFYKKEALINHICNLALKGYFDITKSRGTVNRYHLNIEKIEEDFNLNIEDYYENFKLKTKRK